MASPTADQAFQRLRAKYKDLTRKYENLVRRLRRRALRENAISQLGSWGLRMRGSALLLVRSGTIMFANPGFYEFSRRDKGRWIEESTDRFYPDLRAVVCDEASRVRRVNGGHRESIFRSERNDLYVSVKAQQAKGRPSYVVVILDDVSEEARRDLELAHTREALAQRERLRVLGELAAAVAHDLGNTLRGASFEIAAIDGRPEGSLSGVARRVEVASRIVGQLHDFARKGSVTTVTVNLREIIDEAVALAEIELREGAMPIRVERKIPELPLVRGSAAELSLLFVNLLRNARDAMPDGGAVTIAARVAQGIVEVTVDDDGTGISAAVLPRIFQPFFTTKGSRGAGLGLWLAKGTMSRLGGDIRVSNRRGGGTVFSLTFPIAKDVSPPPPECGPSRGAGERRWPAPPRSRRAPRGSART